MSTVGPNLSCSVFSRIFILYFHNNGMVAEAVIASLVERRTRDRNVASSNPGRRCGRDLILWADSYSVSVPPRVTAMARKRPRSYCQKCRRRVTPKHAYSLDPTKSESADYAAVQVQWGNLSGNELTHNSSGNTLPQSSQLSEPQESADRGWMVQYSSKILASEEKATICCWGWSFIPPTPTNNIVFHSTHPYQ